MRMLSLGCEIGNHTWEHTNVEELSAEDMRREIGSVNEAVYNRFGYTIRLFRPPYIKYGEKGSETRNTLIALMNGKVPTEDQAIFLDRFSSLYEATLNDFFESGKPNSEPLLPDIILQGQEGSGDSTRFLPLGGVSRGVGGAPPTSMRHQVSGGEGAGSRGSAGSEVGKTGHCHPQHLRQERTAPVPPWSHQWDNGGLGIWEPG